MSFDYQVRLKHQVVSRYPPPLQRILAPPRMPDSSILTKIDYNFSPYMLQFTHHNMRASVAHFLMTIWIHHEGGIRRFGDVPYKTINENLGQRIPICECIG